MYNQYEFKTVGILSCSLTSISIPPTRGAAYSGYLVLKFIVPIQYEFFIVPEYKYPTNPPIRLVSLVLSILFIVLIEYEFSIIPKFSPTNPPILPDTPSYVIVPLLYEFFIKFVFLPTRRLV